MADEAKEKKAKKPVDGGAGEAVADFIGNHRKVIVIGAVIILVIVAGSAAGFVVREQLEKAGIRRVEALAERYDALRFSLAETENAEAVETLKADILAECGKTFGYAGAVAWDLAARLHAGLNEWEEAETAWEKSAKKAARSFLAPASLFNAATAAEERGDTDRAIALYGDAAAFADFPQAPRALFSAGRLEENRGEKDAAVESYRQVIEKWPETDWAKFANSRIMLLSGPGA